MHSEIYSSTVSLVFEVNFDHVKKYFTSKVDDLYYFLFKPISPLTPLILF